VIRRTSDGGSIVIAALELWQSLAGEHPEWVEFKGAAQAQLTKCRIHDTEPAPYPNGLRCKSCGADRPHECPGPFEYHPAVGDFRRLVPRESPAPCATCGQVGLHLCKEEESPARVVYLVSQPWRRGHLASWTLVNISHHDGRLTVVMKRGRGEFIDETGPDDEHLWARLGEKARLFTPR